MVMVVAMLELDRGYVHAGVVDDLDGTPRIGTAGQRHGATGRPRRHHFHVRKSKLDPDQAADVALRQEAGEVVLAGVGRSREREKDLPVVLAGPAWACPEANLEAADCGAAFDLR